MNEREQLAKDNGMTIEFVNWFFDNKKDGCGNVWFMMMAAMWEGWNGREAKCAALAADSKKLKRISKAIRLLDVVKSRQRWHSNCRAQMLHLRNGTDGILGATDEHAIAYSNIDMRREFLQSVLDDRPVNWAYARYLENGEWLERCNISRKAFYAQLRQEAAK